MRFLRILHQVGLTAVLLLSGCSSVEIAVTPSPQGPDLAPDKIITTDGMQLPLRRWQPQTQEPDAVVVALHGMNDYGAAFQPLGRYLARRGVATYAYDQRGFGGAPGRHFWPGTDALVLDLRTAVSLIRSRHPNTPIHCAGESMGGAVVMIALARGEIVCDSAILSAPAVWGKQTMSLVQRTALEAAVTFAPDAVVYGTGLRLRPSDNIAALRALHSDPLVLKGARLDAIDGLANLMTEAYDAAASLHGPVLWLYGKNDQIIPPRPTKSAIERLPPDPSIRVARYPLGYHLLTRDLDAAVVAHDVAAWIAGQRGPLPSGADRI